MRSFAGLCCALPAVVFPCVLAAQGLNVSGTWLCEANASLKWVISQEPEAIHVQELNEGKVEADFTCPLNGKACAVKENSHSETIMMYFNGTKLVEIRERGGDALKQWLTVSADGKTLTVETVPLSSNQKTSKVSFRRQSNLMS
jgi:hypothetical protein